MNTIRDDAGIRIALICSLIAMLCGFLPLVGWQLHVPLLTSFGIPVAPTWPLTGLSFLSLAFALSLAVGRANPMSVRLLLVVPTLVAVASLLEHGSGRELGVDWLMFAGQLRSSPASHPGRPGSLTSIVLLLLVLAMALAIQQQPAARRASAMFASFALGLGLVTVTLVPQLSGLPPQERQHIVTAAPAALAALMLAAGVLAFRADSGWGGLLASTGPEWRLARLLFPLLLVAPVAASLVEGALYRSGTLSRLAAQIVAVGLNGGVVAGLMIWGGARLMHQRSALEELTHAADSAALALTDGEGRITHWSRGCEDLYGWTAAEAEGRLKHELLNPGVRHGEGTPTGDREQRDGDRELLEWRRDGTPVRVLEQARWVQRRDGSLLQVLSMTNIGPRLDAEAAIRESEERLMLATSAHQVGVFEWDAGSGQIIWSPGSEQRLGLEPGALSSFGRWASCVMPGDVAAVSATIEAAVAQQAPRFGFTYRLRGLNGSVRTLEGSSRCFYDAHGALLRAVGVTIDVTEREERETALQTREAQLRSILETVPDAMIVIDERGTIERFSRAAEELFGYPEQKALGRNVSMLMGSGDRAAHDRYLEHVVQTGGRRVIGRNRTLVAIRADGGEFPIELRVGEALVGKRRMFIGFVRDISERLAAEERMSQLRLELIHASRLNAMGEMAASLAHELNQPLAAIVNFLATAEMMLKAGADPERVGEMLAMAGGQSTRAGEIIRRLREFISGRETEMRAEPVDRTIHDAVALVQVAGPGRDASIAYDLDPAANTMLADRVQIQQVLVNLLRNSMEALRPLPRQDQEVRIASRLVADDLLEISVEDSGPGIPQTVLARMYTPFTSTKGNEGMGLGLSICRRIVEAHGGQIVAENMAEGGARFRFTLPRLDEQELQA